MSVQILCLKTPQHVRWETKTLNSQGFTYSLQIITNFIANDLVTNAI